MNEEKFLIINKANNDITSIVYKYTLLNNYCYIYYNNNKTKPYKYSCNTIKVIENPTIIDKNVIIKVNNYTLPNVDKILQFRSYIKVFFKDNKKKLYNESEVSIEQNILNEEQNKEIFNYLKEIATHLRISDMNKTEINKNNSSAFLKKIYDKITSISENSVLNIFLKGQNNNTESLPITNFIYPFSFNLSQKEAIYNAFNNRISVIEGPPGTGKTQTILNIIVNAIFQGKTIAILSNNNSATNNVYEKLEKEDLSHIAAKLGKKDNINTFFNEYNSNFSYPINWSLTKDEETSVKERINNINHEADLYLKQINEISDINKELDCLKLEQKYFINYIKTNNLPILKDNQIPDFNSKKLRNFLVYLNNQENKTEYFSKKVQILSQIKFPFINFKLYKNDVDKILANIEYSYYNNRINELENKLKEINLNISSLNLESSFKEYTELSMKIFKSYLYKNYNSTMILNINSLSKTNYFTKFYPVILSTTYSLSNCISEEFMFDYIVIDESSQVDLVSSFPALLHAENAIIVGDSKQLPAIIDSDKKAVFESIFKKYCIDDKYDYTKNNLLSFTKNLYDGIPLKILREHYRCHPKIIEFCNKCFYDEQLIILSKSDDITPIKHFKSVKGNHARKINKSWYNDRELEIIKNEIIPNENISTNSIGIITPYKAQKEHLLDNLKCDNITIDTVHGFQGREKDIIIFSTVANDITPFLDNPNSINVAVSRAKNKLYLITPYEYKYSKNSNISNLINYIDYNNFEVIESKVSSIFDLLYKVNEEKRNSFFKTNPSTSKYLSEGLIFNLISEILAMKEYSTYDVNRAYPLRLVVNNRNILTDEENLFIKTNSHLDFIIYNKFNKEPILAIEVDGYSFHSKQKQIIRDNKKDSILNKCNIPLLRLKTNECNEKVRIINKLNDIIKSNN